MTSGTRHRAEHEPYVQARRGKSKAWRGSPGPTREGQLTADAARRPALRGERTASATTMVCAPANCSPAPITRGFSNAKAAHTPGYWLARTNQWPSGGRPWKTRVYGCGP